MSEIKIRRRCRSFGIALSTTTTSATTLRLEDWAGAVVDMGTIATAVTTLNVYGAASEDGPWRALYSSSGAAVTMTLAPSTNDGRTYSMPDEAFALAYCKLVANDAGAEGVPANITIKS